MDSPRVFDKKTPKRRSNRPSFGVESKDDSHPPSSPAPSNMSGLHEASDPDSPEHAPPIVSIQEPQTDTEEKEDTVSRIAKRASKNITLSRSASDMNMVRSSLQGASPSGSHTNNQPVGGSTIISSPLAQTPEKGRRASLTKRTSHKALRRLLSSKKVDSNIDNKRSSGGSQIKALEQLGRRNQTSTKSIAHDAVNRTDNDMDRTAFSTKRYRIIQEMKDSERTYVTSLHTAIMLFLTPLERGLSEAGNRPIRNRMGAENNPSPAILNQDQIDSIFGNIREVAGVTTNILQDLEVVIHPKAWSAQSTVGDFFIDMLQPGSEMRRVYKAYIEAYGKRLKVLSGPLPPEFTKYRQRQESSKACTNQTLSSFLVQPVQRIPRYTLLLRDIRKNTAPDHPDFELLGTALKMMEAFTEELEQARRESDEREELLELLEKVSSKEKNELELGKKHLIANGTLNQSTEMGKLISAHVLLFNDLVVCCKVKDNNLRIHWYVNLQNCRFSKETDAKGKSFILLLELRVIDTYPFSCEREIRLYPDETPPYDMGFWMSNFTNAVSTFWFDDLRALQSSASFANFMRSKLLSQTDIKRLCIGSPKTTHSKGDIIISEGSIASSLYYVLKGSVKVEKVVNGTILPLSRHTAGDFIGEFSFLRRTFVPAMIREATVVCEEDDTEICCISFSTMDTILESEPELCFRFFRLLTCLMANRVTFQHYTRLRKRHLKFFRKASLQALEHLLDEEEREYPDLAEDSPPGSRVEQQEAEKTENVKEKEPEVADPEAGFVYPLVEEIIPVPSNPQFAPRKQENKYTKMSKDIPAEEELLKEVQCEAKGPDDLQTGRKITILVFETMIAFTYKHKRKVKVLTFHKSTISSVLWTVTNVNQVLVGLENNMYNLTFETEAEASQVRQLLLQLHRSDGDGDKPEQPESNDLFGMYENNEDSHRDTMQISEYEWSLLLKETSTEAQYNPRQIVVNQNDPLTSLFLVKSGAFVEIFRDSDGGIFKEDPLNLTQLFIGVLAFVQGGTSNCTVEVPSGGDPLVVNVFHRNKVYDFCEKHPVIGGKLFRLLAAQLTFRFIAVQNILLRRPNSL